MNNIVPCVLSEVDDPERRILKSQLIGCHAFRKRLLDQHTIRIALFLIHDPHRSVIDLCGNHRIIVSVKISQQDFGITAA